VRLLGRPLAWRLVLILALGLATVVAFAGPAQAQRAPSLREIEVEGTQRIDPETVRSYVLLKPGEAATAEELDRTLKALFATGLFADVTLRMESDRLFVRVVENPIINRIAFEGNRRLNDQTLQAEVQLRPRVVYTRTKVQNDVKRILDLYRRSGRFAATVEPKVVQLPQNRVDLIYEVNEGSVTGVRRINFIGNRQFSDGTLREVIRTVESRWWRILSTDDNYDPDRVSFDRELLRKYYLANGYADFRVVSAVAELTPDRDGFYITFTIEEGERYRFGSISVISQLRDVKAEDLRERVLAKQGDWYNAEAVERSINAVTGAVGSLGYAFVDVRPRIDRDREAKTVSVTYEVQEGPRVYVDRINISGNVRTLDRVIRREFQLVEGDAFSTAKMRRSRQKIQNLGYFERVDVTNVPGDTPDRTTVNVEVRERSTGELSLGFGYSTTDGVLGDIRLRERNLLGRGQDLQMGFTISQRRQEVDLGFTEPYFLDRELAAGFDLFKRKRDLKRISGYEEHNTGFVVRAGYQISEPLRHIVRYTLRQDELTDLDANVSRFIRANAGESVMSAVGQDLTYDRRDDRFDPTEGYYLRLSNDLAGLGGDANFLRNRVTVGTYYSVIEEWVASLTGEVGYLEDFGEKTRIQHRFFLGGDSLRGFSTGGVGPRETTRGASLGGRELYAGSAELTFPSGLPRELGIRTSIFSDFGFVTNSGESGTDVLDNPSVRVSAGVGALWRSPFGPVKVSFAKPVRKEEFDKSEVFRFSFGSRF